MDQKRQPNLAGSSAQAASSAAMDTDEPPAAAPEDESSSTIRLDPALHIDPVFHRILLALKSTDMRNLFSLRTVSKLWNDQLIGTLQSQLNLHLFGSNAMVRYVKDLTKYGLREEEFYKLSETDYDELFRRRVRNASPETSTRLPTLMINLKKLIIPNGADPNLDLAGMLVQWTTLESLVIFNLPEIKDEDRYRRPNWNHALSQLTNLTRLELYNVKLTDLDVGLTREVLGGLEHFVLATKKRDPFDFNAIMCVQRPPDYTGQMKRLLGALTPGTLKHLGLVLDLYTHFKYDRVRYFFADWEHGAALAFGLKSLQLGETPLRLLKLFARQCPRLTALNCIPTSLRLTRYYHEWFGSSKVLMCAFFEALVGLKNLRELQITYINRLSPFGMYPPDGGDHHFTPLPTVRRLSLTCRHLYILSDTFTRLLKGTFTGLEEFNMSDYRWNGLSDQQKELLKDFEAVPRKHFIWNLNYHDYYPARLWGRLPSPEQCFAPLCANEDAHVARSDECREEEARWTREIEPLIAAMNERIRVRQREEAAARALRRQKVAQVARERREKLQRAAEFKAKLRPRKERKLRRSPRMLLKQKKKAEFDADLGDDVMSD